MKKFLLLFLVVTSFHFVGLSQTDARLFRYPDVSAQQITFVYGGDVWLVSKQGGLAYKITSSPGEESFPRFSPDGNSIAYSANYNGNTDVYLMSLKGEGVQRLTYNSYPDRMVDWHPDGKTLLIASRKESGSQAFSQFYALSVKGGLPEKLPVPYGELGYYSPDGNKLTYVTRITENYPFKRYRGGNVSPIAYYDFEKREEKVIYPNANRYILSPNGSCLMVQDNDRIGIIKPLPDQKIEKPLRTAEMTMSITPRDEWKQIFNDTWRQYRDFFYDAKMQQVDWNLMKKQYGALVDDAITRWDVTNILIELISELSAGHTYAGGGDVEQTENKPTGFLGIDWALDQGKYKIKKIIQAAPWDHEVKSPFNQPGSMVVEGEYILAVNGMEILPGLDPYAAFEGLAGRTISLMVSKTPNMADAKEVIVDALTQGQESRLRHLEWIESNRLKVDKASNGQLAYMYMPNTGGEGQTELLRQFYAQIDKKGFVIDERFNAGGQLGDRFLEMLDRSPLYYIGWRNGYDMPIPTKANSGPKVMLINGWAGSGGDAFPWGFQQMNMGPIVGERTLGILVGPATTHFLIDNGTITVPDARLFGRNGKWFAEGHGIEPSIEVWDDPAELTKGNDPQLLRAVEEAMKLLKTKPGVLQSRPAYEDRTARGIKD